MRIAPPRPASVAADSLQAPVAVYDGLVQEVTMAPFSTGTGDPMTRVEISLTSPARHTVTQGDDGLVIRIEGDAESADAMESEAEESAAAPAAEDPWAVVPMAETDGESAPIPAAEPEAPAAAAESAAAGK